MLLFHFHLCLVLRFLFQWQFYRPLQPLPVFICWSFQMSAAEISAFTTIQWRWMEFKCNKFWCSFVIPLPFLSYTVNTFSAQSDKVKFIGEKSSVAVSSIFDVFIQPNNPHQYKLICNKSSRITFLPAQNCRHTTQRQTLKTFLSCDFELMDKVTHYLPSTHLHSSTHNYIQPPKLN